MDVDFCVHSSDASPRHSWILDFNLLRSGKFALRPPRGNLGGLPLFHLLLGDHVKNIVFSCGEYEARNYGILTVPLRWFAKLMAALGQFLLGLSTDLMKWHSLSFFTSPAPRNQGRGVHGETL